MWDALLDAMGRLLAFFYAGIPNYGVGIILLTVSIRLLLYPITSKQARSMAAMQRVQPEIKKIQAKYKHDRQKLNEELMAFYKEHKINPLAGCLPTLAQIPVFFALFQVLRNPAKHITEGTELFKAFCPGVGTASDCSGTPGLPVGLEFLSMDLSRGATADHGSLVNAVPFWILVGLVVVSGYFQSRQMTKLQKGRATPQSQMMTRIFPVVFGVISVNLPAGVVLYFFVSNLWQIGQQAVVFGRDRDAAPAGKGAKGSTSTGGSGEPESGRSSWLSRLVPAPPDRAELAEEAESPEASGASEAAAAEATGGARKQEESGRTGDTRPQRSKSRKKKKRKRRR